MRVYGNGGTTSTHSSPGYTVRRGDSMSDIASRHGVSLNALLDANRHIRNPDRIFPGQRLSLPGRSGPSRPQRPDLLASVRQGQVIEHNEVSARVAALQRKLTERGYGVAITGKNGTTTQGLIRDFQRDHSIVQNGRVGPTTLKALESSGASKVKPMAQSNHVSCGQCSVAMAVNALTGKSLTDVDINRRHGFGLLSALNSESGGVNWKDAGNLSSGKWPAIENRVKRGLPVIVGLNGPNFSPSGRGHIVTITDIQGDRVKFADPATGTFRWTTKQAMNNAPSHPDGNFIFMPK